MRVKTQFVVELDTLSDPKRTDTRKLWFVAVPKICKHCGEKLAAPEIWANGTVLSAKWYFLRCFNTETERNDYFELRREALPDMTTLRGWTNQSMTEVQLVY